MVLVAAGRDAPAPPSPPAASLSSRRQRRPLIARRGGTGRNGAGPGDAGAPGPPATPPPAGNVTGSAAPSGAPSRSKPAPDACRAAAEGGYTGTQSWLQGGIVTGTRDWVSRTQPHDCQRRGRSSSLAVNPWLWMLLGHPRDPLPSPSSWHPAGICPWLLPCSTHWWEWEPSWGRLGQLIAEDDPRRRAGGRGHAGNAQAQGVTAPGASGRVFSSGELSLFLGGRF